MKECFFEDITTYKCDDPLFGNSLRRGCSNGMGCDLRVSFPSIFRQTRMKTQDDLDLHHLTWHVLPSGN